MNRDVVARTVVTGVITIIIVIAVAMTIVVTRVTVSQVVSVAVVIATITMFKMTAVVPVVEDVPVGTPTAMARKCCSG